MPEMKTGGGWDESNGFGITYIFTVNTLRGRCARKMGAYKVCKLRVRNIDISTSCRNIFVHWLINQLSSLLLRSPRLSPFNSGLVFQRATLGRCGRL